MDQSNQSIGESLAELPLHALPALHASPFPGSDAEVTEEVREAQVAYLLLQLLDQDGKAISKGDANKFKNGPRTSLGLKPAIANRRRAQLAEQGYIRVFRAGRSEMYELTPDGLDYLAADTAHLKHATFKVKGTTINALVAAARESSFERERSVPTHTELANAVLSEFNDLRRESHGRSGLVPIHEVRKRIADRFGLPAARHDLLDDIILELERQSHVSLLAISDLAAADEQQLNDSIEGVNGTLFYLEVPREQSVTS